MSVGPQPSPHPSTPNAELVTEFQHSIINRDVKDLFDAPDTDLDIVRKALLQGINASEISEANKLARERIANYLHIDVCEPIDQSTIARNALVRERFRHTSVSDRQGILDQSGIVQTALKLHEPHHDN